MLQPPPAIVTTVDDAATNTTVVHGPLGPDPTAHLSFASPAFSPRTRRVSKILLIVLAVIALAEATACVATYLLYSRHYVVTNNATVDADAIGINAPTSGTITRWIATEGSSMHRGQYLGRIVATGGGPRPQFAVKAPGNGTVGLNDASDGEYVVAGETLAIGYDLSNVWVTARVDEPDISRVKVGQPVDLAIDAFSGIPMTGIVGEIQDSAADRFSVYPSTDIDPTDVQKVNQYIAVRIMLTDTGEQRLSPGMSATVHIHTSS
jgi:multidrug resistance efflux pump